MCVLKVYIIIKCMTFPITKIACPELQKDVLLLEEQEGSVNFKIGVMIMKPGQRTDDEMLSNGKVFTIVLSFYIILRSISVVFC